MMLYTIAYSPMPRKFVLVLGTKRAGYFLVNALI